MSQRDLENFYSLSTAYQQAVGNAQKAPSREEYLRWHATGEKIHRQIDLILRRS